MGTSATHKEHNYTKGLECVSLLTASGQRQKQICSHSASQSHFPWLWIKKRPQLHLAVPNSELCLRDILYAGAICVFDNFPLGLRFLGTDVSGSLSEPMTT